MLIKALIYVGIYFIYVKLCLLLSCAEVLTVVAGGYLWRIMWRNENEYSGKVSFLPYVLFY